MKQRFINLLSQVQRPGIDNLINYLEYETDFFTAPASAKFHGAKEGGLLEHSLVVYDNLIKIHETFFEEFPSDALIIVALLHDVCKTNFYKKGFRNVKNDKTGKWDKVEIYEIDDQLPLGHGEKSVIILQRHIYLTVEEIMCIRWHMAGYDDAGRSYAGGQAITKAMMEYPLITALHMADLAANYINQI